MRKICKLKDYIAVFVLLLLFPKSRKAEGGESAKRKNIFMMLFASLHDDDDAVACINAFLRAQ